MQQAHQMLPGLPHATCAAPPCGRDAAPEVTTRDNSKQRRACTACSGYVGTSRLHERVPLAICSNLKIVFQCIDIYFQKIIFKVIKLNWRINIFSNIDERLHHAHIITCEKSASAIKMPRTRYSVKNEFCNLKRD